MNRIDVVLSELSEICDAIGRRELEVKPNHHDPNSVISKAAVVNLRSLSLELARLLEQLPI